MIYTIQREPYIKRIPTIIDRTYGVQSYDVDNLYPQRADEVRNRSFTAKRAVEKTADFIYGKGFEDPALGKLVVNSDRQNANKLLNIISQDKAIYTGFALHFKYNLNYRIAEVCPVEFMYCRLGIPDEWGNVSHIMYNTNWERDSAKTVNPVFEVHAYPVFNPDSEVVKAQIEEYGGITEYPGQILYWTPKPGVYPKCSFDAVFDQAQTQAEIGVFQLSGIQNRFSATTILRYPGTFEDEEKERKFKRKLQPLKGAEGANSIIVIEDTTGDTNPPPLVENVQMQNTDKMYEITEKNVKNAVRESMAVPAPILAQLPENGMFNQEQIKEAYTYFNDVTVKHRTEISEVIEEIIKYWSTPVAVTSYNIKPLQYGDASSTVSPGQPYQPVQPGDQPGAVKPEFNAALAGLTGKQSQNLRRIQRQYDAQKITKAQAIAELKISFGLTEDQALSLLDDDPTNDAV